MNKVYCGRVNEQHLDQTITVFGWVKKNRKLGSLIFLDVGDFYGIVQVVVHEQHAQFKEVLQTNKESVVKITGKLKLRSAPNANLPTGNYEIDLTTFEVISSAEITPFVVDENALVNDDTRLKYRYLDLRRKCNQDVLVMRHKILYSIRTYLMQQEFIEIETPTLCRPTPEGARDYLVPTVNSVGAFYALPQSPQQFKQLLMVGGFDKYFQIAKCYRDEPLRADRQPEFTQLDMECSFIDEQDIQNHIEGLLKHLFKTFLNLDLKLPLVRMEYDEAMSKYGSDKPDLRFACPIQTADEIFKTTNFNIFKNTLASHKTIKYIFVPEHCLTKQDIKDLIKLATDNHALGLAWISYKNKQIEDGSISKIIEPELMQQLLAQQSSTTGTFLFIADESETCLKALGSIRNSVGKSCQLYDPNSYALVWIVNWPLYEYDKTNNRYAAAHHPFTSPAKESMQDFDTNKAQARARSYDIVINGYEVGGGSIRIIDPKIQQRMFKSLGLTETEIQQKFGFLITAFKYGAPIHGGIALGIERLLIIMLKINNIRDVICFPKNSSGQDLMLESPSLVSEQDLVELNLKYIK